MSEEKDYFYDTTFEEMHLVLEWEFGFTKEQAKSIAMVLWQQSLPENFFADPEMALWNLQAVFRDEIPIGNAKFSARLTDAKIELWRRLFIICISKLSISN